MMFEHIPYISAGACPLCGKKMIRHVIKEGARYHVNYWDYLGIHCSEPDCEDNHGVDKCVNEKGEVK
jgi:hypothetical protein